MDGQNCTLCDREDGAVIQCSECPAEYHVSCAWKQGHKFGFEIQQVRPSQDGIQTRKQTKVASLLFTQAKNMRREGTPAVDFKGQSGLMVPSVICKGHISHKRQVYDICDTNDAGEVRSFLCFFLPVRQSLILIPIGSFRGIVYNQTALQVYCRNYKQADVGQTHGLLRKARRLDQILEASATSTSAETSSTVSVDESGASTPGTGIGLAPSIVPNGFPNANGASNSNGNGLALALPAADPHCYRCQTEFSPFFHEVVNPNAHHGAEPLKAWLCHKCHSESRNSYPVIIGIGAS